MLEEDSVHHQPSGALVPVPERLVACRPQERGDRLVVHLLHRADGLDGRFHARREGLRVRRLVRRSRDAYRARAQAPPLERFLARDMRVQRLEGCPLEAERPAFDSRDQLSPRPRLVEHLLGVLDPSSAHRDPVHQRLHFRERERVALERHGVVHDFLEHLARPEDCPRLARWRRCLDSLVPQCEPQPWYFHLRRLLSPAAQSVFPVRKFTVAWFRGLPDIVYPARPVRVVTGTGLVPATRPPRRQRRAHPQFPPGARGFGVPRLRCFSPRSRRGRGLRRRLRAKCAGFIPPRAGN